MLTNSCAALFALNPSQHTHTTRTHAQAWIKENNVLEVVLRDNLHQPQYVEKLEKMLRFCIREKVLSIEDLDKIWASQEGKHEAIVKNIHDLLAKLAWDFSPEQLDRLFKCFQVRVRGWGVERGGAGEGHGAIVSAQKCCPYCAHELTCGSLAECAVIFLAVCLLSTPPLLPHLPAPPFLAPHRAPPLLPRPAEELGGGDEETA